MALDPKIEAHQRLVEQLRRSFGKAIMAAFDDEKVVEIMANPDGKLLVERHGQGIVQEGTIAPQQVQNIIGLVAAWQGTISNAEKPICEGALPPEFGGARFEGCLPPITPGPLFAIRLRARSIYTLEQYVRATVITANQLEIIQQAIDTRKNILVSGGTTSGKTTLVNAIVHRISEVSDLNQRIVIIEDTPEIQCSAPNYLSLLTDDSAKITMASLLKATLRLRPSRIIVGEIRDGAALDLVDAWGTGHPGGAATMHANNPQGALLRLDRLCMRTGAPSQKESIEEAVDIIIQIRSDENHPAGRRITSMWDVKKGEEI
ncbi:P-type conjugative transfer ATPase TrbB [Acidithiobacillus ferrivorans SS3]|uniref:P-type conjugative transfer ATPase TrbB n=1 Tax=Acidithiobacillus ferrivorans SS3 TaxID=743299 RepID=G0JLI3_9PROT|nr:P-type conjugative transfer ATPase TrbB [Acidithiobacillus ferrivorans]AEM48032.1 P-type conjugative transfer ATPase TrbB [Acidithiobacillus ferrivorans SS3]